MFKPRMAVALVIVIALSIYTCSSMPGACIDALAQQSQEAASPDTARGFELYKKGDTSGAIKALRAAVKQHKEDAIAWYGLGLALNSNGDTKDARKAFEKAVKLRADFAEAHAALAYTLLLTNKAREAESEAQRALEINAQNAEAHYVISVLSLRSGDAAKSLEEAETILKLKPDFVPALLLKSQALLGVYVKRFVYKPNESPQDRSSRSKVAPTLFTEAADSLEKYLKHSPQTSETKVWREQLENLRAHAQSVGTFFRSDELTTKAHIIARPEPQYTESARRAQISGTVILRAVFAADGTIKHILVLQSLPFGLTEKALKAARQIKFIPASKEGQPVNQIIQIEYNFNLY